MTSRVEFENDSDGNEYKVEAICNSVVYVKELDCGHHKPDFYY